MHCAALPFNIHAGTAQQADEAGGLQRSLTLLVEAARTVTFLVHAAGVLD